MSSPTGRIDLPDSEFACAAMQFVYDISPADPLMYSIICAVFGGVGLLSAYMPARRVSTVDPVIALRAE